MPSIEVRSTEVRLEPVEAQTFDVQVAAPRPVVQVVSEGPQGPIGPAGPAGTALVQSVNGAVGTVVLDAAAVGALGTAATTDVITEGTTNLYNRVPTGGAAGEVLVKSSATDYASAWEIPSPVVPVGFYRTPPADAQINDTGYERDRVQAFLCDGGLPMSIDRIFLVRTSGSVVGAEARLGIYDASTGVPTTLIGESAVIDISSSGVKEVTVAMDVPRFFCIAFMVWASSTPTLSNTGRNFLTPQNIGTTGRARFRSDTTYSTGASFPNTFPAFTVQDRGYRVGVRRA